MKSLFIYFLLKNKKLCSTLRHLYANNTRVDKNLKKGQKMKRQIWVSKRCGEPERYRSGSHIFGLWSVLLLLPSLVLWLKNPNSDRLVLSFRLTPQNWSSSKHLCNQVFNLSRFTYLFNIACMYALLCIAIHSCSIIVYNTCLNFFFLNERSYISFWLM